MAFTGGELLLASSGAAVIRHGRNEWVKPRGNWILSTSHFPFDAQPYENLHAFADAAREYSRYN